MSTSVAVIAGAPSEGQRLVELVASCGDFAVEAYPPDALPADPPQLYVVHLPALEGAWSTAMETIRGGEATSHVPVVIVSALPYEQLQSIPYASDWTVAIVAEPVAPEALAETIGFLLGDETAGQ